MLETRFPPKYPPIKVVVLYEILALFLFYKNKNQLNELERIKNEQ